ncbi:beta-phosphoglucomutase [Cystobacter fuscus]|uniref:Beta-phosphoglucomutase n=1 Tax=Cystobacter fuscus TaxID=43 RepID=A0A250JK31_9BACT|nr:HAD family phosphatase [Cystobacter fuscus]ATB44013.1 beta-phosphoglucomutase [Cystobacter fuscus]
MQPGTSRPYPFDAVLFDLDGVIIDTTALYYRVWETFARARGRVPTPAELLATNGRRGSETLQAWFGPGLAESDIAAHMHELDAMVRHQLATEPVSAVPGVHRFLEELRRAGVPWALGTSATAANAELALSRLGLSELFPVRVTAAEVTRGKPDPEVYLKAAAALGVAPSACVVIEDSVLGLRAGRAAGARCLALSTTFPRDVLSNEDPTWLAEDFRSLPFSVSP